MDDGKFEVQEQVERLDGSCQIWWVSLAVFPECSHQSPTKPGQGSVRECLPQPDLDMPPTDVPATVYIFTVIAAGEQVTKPTQKRSFQPGDLIGPSCDDFLRIRVPLDFGVEIIDQRWEMWLDHLRSLTDPQCIVLAPAYVLLQLSVAQIESVRPHF